MNTDIILELIKYCSSSELTIEFSAGVTELLEISIKHHCIGEFRGYIDKSDIAFKFIEIRGTGLNFKEVKIASLLLNDINHIAVGIGTSNNGKSLLMEMY